MFFRFFFFVEKHKTLTINPLVLAGSNGLETLLTVTGTGFGSENASIFVGKARCHVEQINGKWKKCDGENAASGCWNELPVCEKFSLILSTFLPDTTQVCRLGSASAGTYPVMVCFPSLGNSRYADGNMFHFTYQLIVSSFSPLSGSVAGKTLLLIIWLKWLVLLVLFFMKEKKIYSSANSVIF